MFTFLSYFLLHLSVIALLSGSFFTHFLYFSFFHLSVIALLPGSFFAQFSLFLFLSSISYRPLACLPFRSVFPYLTRPASFLFAQLFSISPFILLFFFFHSAFANYFPFLPGYMVFFFFLSLFFAYPEFILFLSHSFFSFFFILFI